MFKVRHITNIEEAAGTSVKVEQKRRKVAAKGKAMQKDAKKRAAAQKQV